MTPEQLKASILQYAMEGKLVKQDLNDEPASELLKKIENEKAELIKEDKIKKSKKLPAITDNEKSFDIPNNWIWIRLGNICQPIRYGFTASAKDSGNSRLVRITDIQNNNVNWNNVPFCDVPEIKLKDLQLKPNDILIARTGGTVGKSFVVQNISEVAVFASYLIRIRLINNELVNFLKYFLDSPYYWKMISLKQSGTGQPNVNATKLSEILLPLPPLEEQKRIVAKIEKLMPLVDEYAESYNRLQKIDNEFEDKLKQSVLQYAMEGKLIKQDPNDEPASELIKKIETEKAELIKEGKIKKSKKLPAVTDDEKPFNIPDSWEWVRLGSILYNLDGKRVPVSVSERNKKAKVYDYYGASGVIDKIDNYIFSKPLLLISEDGANLLARRTPIAFIATGKYWVNNHAHVFDGINLLFLKYISIFIESIDVSKYVTGTAQPKLNQQNLNKILVAVPPLEEQKRIVAKIEKIMNSINNH